MMTPENEQQGHAALTALAKGITAFIEGRARFLISPSKPGIATSVTFQIDPPPVQKSLD